MTTADKNLTTRRLLIAVFALGYAGVFGALLGPRSVDATPVATTAQPTTTAPTTTAPTTTAPATPPQTTAASAVWWAQLPAAERPPLSPPPGFRVVDGAATPRVVQTQTRRQPAPRARPVRVRTRSS